ncbi:hypothetical protein SNE25_06510 [Mucilaginibacter sabulilitoris]|uniref:Uncharacterized protein n=1 Tax=Mucilaginibacter sabulilitoris TaxID=1173583 RepID=A0ABZ0TQP3_9SPHI|nr:hypothetical protein [Mucilaginibacter sabulilitoris]WPU95176.1 hypothetical protein SNE25_06510 [Mucilaginibacter sabulilitoris]
MPGNDNNAPLPLLLYPQNLRLLTKKKKQKESFNNNNNPYYLVEANLKEMTNRYERKKPVSPPA